MTVVGILTYHRAANDGSILQAASLASLLRREGLAPKIIDYLPVPSDRFDLNWLRSVKAWTGQRGSPRLEYLKSRVALTPTLGTMTQRSLARLVEREGVERLVFGSDTIWDAANREFSRTTFKPTLVAPMDYRPGLSHAYFAGSADPTFSFEGRSDLAASLTRSVANATFCGVRDDPTWRMLLGLGVDPALLTYTPDPTLLAWPDDLVPPADQATGLDGPIGLQMTSRPLREAIKAELAARGRETIDFAAWAEVHPVRGSGIEGFRAGMMARLKLGGLVTDRFHGAIIFSMINRHAAKPLIALEDTIKWSNGTGKLTDLFQRAGAPENVIPVDPADPARATAIASAIVNRTCSLSDRVFQGFEALARTASPAIQPLVARLR